jgi:hypothetical protein
MMKVKTPVNSKLRRSKSCFFFVLVHNDFVFFFYVFVLSQMMNNLTLELVFVVLPLVVLDLIRKKKKELEEAI